MTRLKTNDLTEGPLGRTLVKLTIPMVFGTLSIVLFNLADTYFVGLLGTRELAALSFTFPVVMVIHSLAIGLGNGASVIISQALGAQDHDRARRLTTDSLLLAITIVIAFVTVGVLTLDPLFAVLGAPRDILPVIRTYMLIWYVGMVFVVVPMVGNNAMRAAGDTATPSIVMMLSAALNIVLDPILIFGYGPIPRLEVAGAAIATVLSRAISLGLSLWFLSVKKRMVAWHIPSLTELLGSWRDVLYIGLPTAGTRAVVPLATGVITAILAGFSTEAVAAYGVAQRIEFLALTVVVSLAVVFGPFSGQNLGAGRIGRIRDGIKLGNGFSILSGLVTYALLAALAPDIATRFSENPEVQQWIVTFLHIVPAGYALFGVFMISVTVIYVFKKPFHAAGLSVLQMFGLTIPLAFIGAHLYGIHGVFGAIAAGYAGSGIAAWIVLYRIMPKSQNNTLRSHS